MDRLISEKQVLDILPKYRLEESIIAEEVKAIPSAEPYKGMTNGEVVKAVFDVDEIQVTENTVIVRVKGSFCAKMQFLLDWWTAKYEGEQNE